MGLVDQPPQRAVIRLVKRLDPSQRVVDGKPLAIDFLPVADHARDGAEAAGHPHRAGIGKTRQASGEHPRIELIGLAVHVDIGAGKIDPNGRKAVFAQVSDQFVHERILGAAQRGEVDPGGVEEFERIDRAGMGRVEDDRRPPMRRLHDLERGRQLAIKLGHLGRRPLNVRFPFGPIDHATDSAGRAGLCKDVLSVIVIILPSEKSHRTTGRCRKRLKSAALIDLGTFRYRNSTARRHQEAVTFHPKFTLCRA